MNIRRAIFSVAAVLVVMPMWVWAAGLVPCGTRSDTGLDTMCQTCHILQLVNGVTTWLVGILSVVAAIMFIIAGFRMVMSNGNPSALKEAKDMIINVAIGFVIVLSAWFLIDTLMKALLVDGSPGLGMWNTISCIPQPDSTLVDGNLAISGRLPGYPDGKSRGTAAYSAPILDPIKLQALASIGAPDDKVVAAAQNAGLNAEQTRNLQALMRVESAGCRDLESPVGALGCMQIMPNTAKLYDPSLNGLSSDQLRNKLLDEDYNIALGARIYADLYQRLGGDEIKVFAAYNGGEGALAPSRDCPGLARYQCVWDSPGCYGTQNTNCTPNTGYIETRNYVEKVAGVAEYVN